MRIDEILIPSNMLMSNPSSDKIASVMSYMINNREFDKPIKVSKDGILVDGLIRYIVYVNLKKEGEADDITPLIKVVKGNINSYKYKETKYVFGHHEGNNKEYVWRLPDRNKNVDILVGQKVIVNTSYGKLPITVSRVELLDEPPRDGRIKKVIVEQ